jgi:hypothetical protein
MSMSNELATYADVKAVLDKVLDCRQPLHYKLRSYKAAMRWRYRVYHFRKLLRKQDAIRLHMKDIQVATPYDGLQIAVADMNGLLLIKFSEIEGELSDTVGNIIPVTITHILPETSDPDQALIDDLKAEVLKDGNIL